MIMPSGERVSREKAMADPGRVGRGEPGSYPSPARASRSASGSRCDGVAMGIGCGCVDFLASTSQEGCGPPRSLGMVGGTDRTTSMDITRRRELASRLLDGYVHGPAAATEATARALAKVAATEAVVLAEGISDQIAVETLAARGGRERGAGRPGRRLSTGV